MPYSVQASLAATRPGSKGMSETPDHQPLRETITAAAVKRLNSDRRGSSLSSTMRNAPGFLNQRNSKNVKNSSR